MCCNEQRQGAVRPSCLECVEKHLGAALVLIDEVNDGYAAHRLLAVGHLFQAQVESRQWPELSQAIRQARREYQRTGTSPPFDHLASMLEALQVG